MPERFDHSRRGEAFRGSAVVKDRFERSKRGELPRFVAPTPETIEAQGILATSSVGGSVVALKNLFPATVSATSQVSLTYVKTPLREDQFDHKRRGEVFRGGANTIDQFDHKRRGETPKYITVSFIAKIVTAGSVAATSSVSGGIVMKRSLVVASVGATSTVSGYVGVQRKLAPASVSAASSVGGTLSKGGLKAISGSIAATSSIAGRVNRVFRVVGSVSATSAVSGYVGVQRRLQFAAVSATSSVSGAFVRSRAFTAGSIAATAAVSGATVARRGVAATINASTSVSAAIGKSGSIGDKFDHARRQEVFRGGGALDKFDRTRRGELPRFINLILLPGVKNVVPADSIIAFSVVSGSIRKPKLPVSGSIAATSSFSGSLSGASIPGDKLDHKRRAEPFRGGGRVTDQFNHGRRGESARLLNISTALPAGPGLRPIGVGVVSATSSVGGTVTKTGKLTPSAINAISAVSGAIGRRTGGFGGSISATSAVGFAIGGTYGSGLYGSGIYGEGGNGNIPVLRRILPSPIMATSSIAGTGLGRGHTIFPNVVFAVAQVSGGIGRRYQFTGTILSPATVAAVLTQQRTSRGVITSTTVVAAVISHGGGGVAVGQVLALSVVSGRITHVFAPFVAFVTARSVVSSRLGHAVPLAPLAINAFSHVGGRVVKRLIFYPIVTGHVYPQTPTGRVAERGRTTT